MEKYKLTKQHLFQGRQNIDFEKMISNFITLVNVKTQLIGTFEEVQLISDWCAQDFPEYMMDDILGSVEYLCFCIQNELQTTLTVSMNMRQEWGVGGGHIPTTEPYVRGTYFSISVIPR